MIRAAKSKWQYIRFGRFQFDKFHALTDGIDKTAPYIRLAIYCCLVSIAIVTLTVLYFAFQDPSDFYLLLNRPMEALKSIAVLILGVWLVITIPSLLIRFVFILLISFARGFVHEAPRSQRPSSMPENAQIKYGEAALNELRDKVEWKQVHSIPADHPFIKSGNDRSEQKND